MDLDLYRFDVYELDTAEQLLLREGRPVPLTPKAFAILLMLVERSGHVVSKTDLMKAVWGDTCVEEANLTQNIFTLRRILSEGIDGKKYIETVSRRGYRFVASVSRIPPIATLQPAAEDQQKKSIAVLPFADGNLDGTFEYLADGIAESIINSLSELPQLRVLAWTAVSRYKGKDKDPREIGTELGVANFLSGRLRCIDNKLIISAELVDVRGGWQVWGETFNCDAEGLFEVQQRIAKQISDGLKLKLTADERQRLTKRYTENSEAYLHYLRGRYHWAKYTKQGIETAIQCFRRAIELDPTYALAYVGIGDSYFRLSTSFLPPTEALAKAKEAVKQALELDDGIAEAHASLGAISAHCDWNWDTAEFELKKAIRLRYSYPVAHQWLGMHYQLRGRFKEALGERVIALDLDPLSIHINVSLAITFWGMRDYESAHQLLLNALEMDPQFQSTLVALGMVLEQQKKFDESIAAYERANQLGETSFITGFLARAYALSGQQQRAQALVEKLIEESKCRYISPYSITQAFLGLGNRDAAFVWLEKAYEVRDEWLCLLKTDPRGDSLREDPRLNDLLGRIGLSG